MLCMAGAGELQQRGSQLRGFDPVVDIIGRPPSVRQKQHELLKRGWGRVPGPGVCCACVAGKLQRRRLPWSEYVI